MLADSPELLSFLSQIDSDHQFNIGSPFLRAGLTRIADESIAPGLDSDFMVRSLLYAICGEVRHETQGKAATEEPDSRSAERRVGKECVSTCKHRGARYH